MAKQKRGSEYEEWAGKNKPLTDEEKAAAKHQLRLSRERATNSDLKKQVRYLRGRLEETEAGLGLILGTRTPPPPVYRIKTPKKSTRNSSTSITLASDWHFDEIIKPEWVSFKNSQDLGSAEEKIHRFGQNVVKLYKKESIHASFVEHIAWWGGDFWTGHIHEDFKEITPFTPLESMRFVKPKIVAMLRYWRQEMDCKTLTSLFSISNHGRDNEKKQIAKSAEHSFDWYLGLEIRDAFTDDKTGKVEDGYEFINPLSYNYIMDVGGYKINFHHGHEGSYYRGGVGGVQVSLNRYRGAMQDVLPSDCHMIGHYHQKFDAQHLTINNTMMGYNPYAMSKGFSFDHPSQTFVMIDMERRCKSGVFPVYVE